MLVWCFFDAAGTYIAYEPHGNAVTYASEVRSIADMQRSVVFGTAPSNAKTAFITIRSTVVNNDPYTFFSRAYFGEAGVSQTEASPWSPGPTTIITSNILDNAVTLPFTTSLEAAAPGAGNSSYIGPMLTYTFNSDYPGKAIVLWTAEASTLREFRFRLYLNGDPASYTDTFPLYDFEGNLYAYGYTSVPPTAYNIGETWAGGAFQDQPIILGYGDTLAGTNTVRVWVSNKNNGTVSKQKLVIWSAKK